MTVEEILQAINGLSKKEVTSLLHRAHFDSESVVQMAAELPDEARQRLIEVLESNEEHPIGWFNADGVLRGSERPMEGRCGAHLKRTRPPRYCINYPKAGKNRCHKCCGSSPGVSHWNYGNAANPSSKYYKNLPKHMKERYEAALTDEEHTSLRDELALLTARISQMLEQLEELPPWSRALAAFEKLAKGDHSALEELGQLLYEGNDAATKQAEVWGELKRLIDLKTKTAAAEWKRLKEMEALVTVEEALGFAQAFLEAAHEVIADRQVLRKLQEKTLCLLPPA